MAAGTTASREGPVRARRGLAAAVLTALLAALAAFGLAGGALAAQTLFEDGFESGNLASWTFVSGLTVQSAHVDSGSYAARATNAGGVAQYAYQSIADRGELYVRVRFKIVTLGSTIGTVLRLRASGGAPILTVGVSQNAFLQAAVGANGPVTSTLPTSPGVWHELQVHLVAGSSGTREVWLNGTRAAALSGAFAFDQNQIGRIQLGDDVPAHVYDIAFDELLASDAMIPDTTPPAVPAGLAATAVSAFAVNLNWQPARDNLAVFAYELYRDGILLTTLGAGTSYRDEGLQPESTHSYALRAKDAAGNRSALSASTSVTLPPPPAPLDLSPPTAPANVVATATGPTSVNLSWTASTDDVGVTAYTIERNGAVIAAVPGSFTAYADAPLVPATVYTYTLTATDAAGRRSAASAPATATTPVAGGGPITTIITTTPTVPQRPRPLAMRVLTPRLAAAPGVRTRLRFSIGAPGRVTIRVLRNGRRVGALALRARRGVNAVMVRAPRPAGRYLIELNARPTGYAARRVRATLTVRAPVRR